MKALNIFIAALGGVVVGAAAGMLMAPKKGVETRREIVDYLQEKFPFLKRSKVEELADKIAEEING